MPNVNDPSWDYAKAWRYLDVIAKRAVEIRDRVANTENAAPNLERELELKLLDIQTWCEQAISLLPSRSFLDRQDDFES